MSLHRHLPVLDEAIGRLRIINDKTYTSVEALVGSFPEATATNSRTDAPCPGGLDGQLQERIETILSQINRLENNVAMIMNATIDDPKGAGVSTKSSF